MSELLDALIEQRRKEAWDYQEYLRKIVEFTKKVTNPEAGGTYPKTMNTPGKRALYDNLDKDEVLALTVDGAVRASRQDDWRGNAFKVKKVRNAIRTLLEAGGTQGSGDSAPSMTAREGSSVYSTASSESMEERVERILSLVKNQDEY